MPYYYWLVNILCHIQKIPVHWVSALLTRNVSNSRLAVKSGQDIGNRLFKKAELTIFIFDEIFPLSTRLLFLCYHHIHVCDILKPPLIILKWILTALQTKCYNNAYGKITWTTLR